MYFRTLFHVASLRQLSASYRRLWEAPWTCCYAPDSCCRRCFGHWEVSLNVNQVSSFLIEQWISPIFLRGSLQPLSRATMHNSIHCMVLETQPLFLTSSTKCDASTKHDALLDGIRKNNGDFLLYYINFYRSIWTPSEIFGPPSMLTLWALGTAGWSTLLSFGTTVQASHS